LTDYTYFCYGFFNAEGGEIGNIIGGDDNGFIFYGYCEIFRLKVIIGLE